MMEMPPLPEPAAIVRRWTTNSVSVDIPPPLLRSLQDGERLYTADQIQAAILSERERCARNAAWAMPPIPPDLLSRISNSNGCDSLNAAVEYAESCARMAREEAAKLVEGMWEIDGDHTARQFAAAIRKG